VYEGFVAHSRAEPVHQFRYPVSMLYLDLDEIPVVFGMHPLWRAEQFAPASFYRRDYLSGDASRSLKDEVHALLQRSLGFCSGGPVALLTHVRNAGIPFNPVSFYYCFNADRDHLEAIITEITNTPWHQRHAYVLSTGQGLDFHFNKSFHVSPFMDMSQTYDWRFSHPGPSLSVRMKSEHSGKTDFEAVLQLKRQPLSRGRLSGLLLRYPLNTTRVLTQIYGNALKLLWKGAPFFTHPMKQKASPGCKSL
jgi:uncharacterized protein